MFPPVVTDIGCVGLRARCDSVDAACMALTATLGRPSVDGEQVIGDAAAASGMWRSTIMPMRNLGSSSGTGYAGFEFAQSGRRADRRGGQAPRTIFADASAQCANDAEWFDHATELFDAAAADLGDRLGVRPVLRRRARLLAEPQPRRPRAVRAATASGPWLGQPRPPHLPLQPRRVSAAHRLPGANGLSVPRAVLRRTRGRLGRPGLEQPECRRRHLRRRRPLARGSDGRLRSRTARRREASSARSACGANCTARRSSTRACITWSASSISTPPARSSPPGHRDR